MPYLSRDPSNNSALCFPIHRLDSSEIPHRHLPPIHARSIHHKPTILRPPRPPTLPILMLLRRPRRRQEIHEESQDVKRENERDDPLNDGPNVRPALVRRCAEDDGEYYFQDDKDEFGPEGEAEDSVLAEMDAEALIFGTVFIVRIRDDGLRSGFFI